MSKEEVQSDIGLLIPEFQIIVSGIMNLVVIKNWLPFQIFETRRSQERQDWLVANGYSKTLKSNHSSGRAVDIVWYKDGKWSWEHDDDYKLMAGLVKEKFDDKVIWGGDFKGFYDPYHWEMR